MARQQQHEGNKIGFKSVKLLKDQTLGIGSYGAVCKAKCDDLLCAAKILHPTLFDPTAQLQVSPKQEHRLPIKRFEQECEFLSTIRHPNIVQYLCMHQDPDTGLPVLLMELMDESLTHFLESSPQPIAYHVQANICHDIALALSFLHSNGVIHRDLSGNNVLLHRNNLAKVTDFGMAKLGDLNPQATRHTFTMCPGTDVYMPPEAVKDEPVYTEKIDCFSFGVIVIQTLTRQFPKPGNRRREVEIDQPGLPRGTVEIRLAEVDRRQNDISQVDPNHPLLPIALDCLKDKDIERPSAQQVCERVASLKERSEYSDSMEGAQQEKEQLRQQLQQLQQFYREGTQQMMIEKEKQLEQLRQQLQELQQVSRREGEETGGQQGQAKQQQLQELRGKIQEKDRQVEQLTQQLRELQQKSAKEKEENKRELERVKQELERVKQQYERRHETQQIVKKKKRQLGQMRQQLQELQRSTTKEREESDKSVTVGQIIQQLDSSEQERAKLEKELYALREQFHQLEEELLRLKDQPPQTFTLLQCEATKGTIETSRTDLKVMFKTGKESPFASKRWSDATVDGNRVYILNGVKLWIYDIDKKKWSRLPSCIYYNASFKVLNGLPTTVGGSPFRGEPVNNIMSLVDESRGGVWREKFPPMPTRREYVTAVCIGTVLIVAGGRAEKELTTVEVLNIKDRQWSTAACLPEPLHCFSATVSDNLLYMLGGEDSHFPSNSVYTCSVGTLLQSARHYERPPLSSSNSSDGTDVWSKLTDVPVPGSTCVTFYGQLLAIGGLGSDRKPTTAVYMYNPSTNSWNVISHMRIARRYCFAAVLPDNQLMVVGGEIDKQWTCSDSVEFGCLT